MNSVDLQKGFCHVVKQLIFLTRYEGVRESERPFLVPGSLTDSSI